MSVYYGVQRSKDYLAHYGVKGMKWGVQKALDSGSDRKLSRQYAKARKKLGKLNLKANVEYQKQIAKKHNAKAAAALGVGLAGVGGLGLNNAIARRVLEKAGVNLKKVSAKPDEKFRRREKKVVSSGKGVEKKGQGIYEEAQHQYDELVQNGFVYPDGAWIDAHGDTHYGKPKRPEVPDFKHPSFDHEKVNAQSTASVKQIQEQPNIFKTIRNVSAGLAAGGLATAAYQKGQAIASKRRTTEKGHAKAVAKRDAWQKEMEATFKGTRFDKKASSKKSKKRR